MSGRSIPIAIFRLGRIHATPRALTSLNQEDISLGIQRHQAGDWGDLSEEDRLANDRALMACGRLFSSFKASNGTKFWIITEADRSATTVLLPEDY